MIAVGWGTWVVACAAAILSLDLIADSDVVALGAVDPAATTVAALALLVGAAAILTTASGAPTGVLLALAAVCWTAPLVEGHQTLPDPMRSIAAVCSALLVPVLASATLLIGDVGASGTDARARAVDRRIAWWILAGGSALVVATALVRDPLLDPDCWANCSANSFLLVSVPPVARLLEVVLAAYAAAAVAASVWAAWSALRGVRATAVGWGGISGSRATASATGAAATIAAGVLVAVLALGGPTVASTLSARLPYLICATVLVVFGAAVTTAAVAERRRAAALTRFGDELRRTPRPGRLESDLRAVLRDPGLRVRFPSGVGARPGVFIDAAGRATSPPAPQSRTTEIRRDGRPIAVLEHTVPVASTAELEARIGPAARIAIDNERMRALVLAELGELRASRQRIVETADAARRGVERDLHDRAQQSLLAALFELGIVTARAVERGDPALERAAEELRGRVNALVAALRRLAHGVFPAVLDDAGLDAALERLAEASTVPIEVHSRLATRLPAAVERAAYAVAVHAAEHTDAATDVVDIEIGLDGGMGADGSAGRDGGGDGVGTARLVIRPAPRGNLVGVGDRVGALGGSMLVSDDRMEVVIPCE